MELDLRADDIAKGGLDAAKEILSQEKIALTGMWHGFVEVA